MVTVSDIPIKADSSEWALGTETREMAGYSDGLGRHWGTHTAHRIAYKNLSMHRKLVHRRNLAYFIKNLAFQIEADAFTKLTKGQQCKSPDSKSLLTGMNSSPIQASPS